MKAVLRRNLRATPQRVLPTRRMIAFALLPLGAYFLSLGILCARPRPTILGGPRDTMLLALGLFGLLTFGPGKLLIPLDLLAFWGWLSGLFWISFYFVVAYFVSERQAGRIVVYGASERALRPRLLERYGGSGNRFEGNVLYLPDFGIQCSVTGNSAYTLFRSTNSPVNRENWRRFEQELDVLCRNSSFAVDRRAAFFWTASAVVLLAVAAVALVVELPALVRLFLDYWMNL